MTKTLSFTWMLILLTACDGKQEPPKVNYDESQTSDTLSIEKLTADTTKVLVVDLPFYFDSTEVLLSPIGFVDLETLNKRGGSMISKVASNSRYSEGYEEAPQAYLSSNSLSGSFTNILFEDLKTNEQRILTAKVLIIRQVQYLKEIARKMGKHYLLYYVYDRDTNKDGELNRKDIETLYISHLDGTNFTKVIADGLEYDSGKLILPNTTYYVRAKEGPDKDGYFGKNDKYRFYAIDLSGDTFRITEYNPLSMLKK